MSGRLRRAVRALFEVDPSLPSSKAALQHRHEEKQQMRLQRLAHRDQLRSEISTPAGNDASVVRLDYETHDIRLIATSPMEREWRAHSCAKEPWTVDWIEESLKNGGVLYDIGANTGAFTLVAAKVGGVGGTVVAFEPGYASYAHLCDNIVLNHCEHAVIPVPLALGGRSGIGRFRYRSLHAGQSRHEFRDAQWERGQSSSSRLYEQPMLSMTLDDAVRQFGLPAPNHIKLDVDGSEVAVLRGASATLSAPGLRSILIEIDDANSEPAVAMLVAHGFVLDQRHKRVHEEQTQVWYGVFRRAFDPVSTSAIS